MDPDFLKNFVLVENHKRRKKKFWGQKKKKSRFLPSKVSKNIFFDPRSKKSAFEKKSSFGGFFDQKSEGRFLKGPVLMQFFLWKAL